MIDFRISRCVFSSYRDRDWAWRCLERNTFSNICHHIHKSNLRLSLKALSLVRVSCFSVGIETRMISNDWYTSFLCSVGIIDYDRLASNPENNFGLFQHPMFYVLCFMYHSSLTKAKPEAVKSQTSKNTRLFKQIKMNLNQTTKNGKASTWRLDWHMLS